jgi:hypothetical protein
MFDFRIKSGTLRALFLVGLFLGAGDAWAVNSPDYFPLTQGSTWEYTNGTVEASGTQEVNGVTTTILEGGGGNQTFNTADEIGGIRLYGNFTLNVNGSGRDLILTFDPPIGLAFPSTNVGDNVPSSGNAHFDFSCSPGTADLPYTANFNFVDMPDVTVPAGPFQDVMQLNGTIHIDAGQSSCLGTPFDIPAQNLEFTFYLALNVGTVRLISPAGTAELINSNLLDGQPPGGQPVIDVAPSPWNFGNVQAGGGQSDKVFTVQNVGEGTLNGSASLVGGAGNFSIISGGDPFSLGAGGTHLVTVRFAPTSEGLKQATLSVSSSDPGVNPVDVPLNGTGTSSPPPPTATLTNLSTRAQAGLGPDQVIVGVTIGGATATTVLVRALGPTLGLPPFNVPGALADPVLQVFPQGQIVPIAQSDNWMGLDPLCLPPIQTCGGPAAIAATGVAPPHDLEAAVLLTLPPGAYTAIVSGVGATTGVALVDVFAVGGEATARLTNLSTRAQAGLGPDQVIVGVTIGGATATTVLVRALGPTLGLPPFNVPGALADPVLQVFPQGQIVPIAQSDNWMGLDPLCLPPIQTCGGPAAIAATGVAPPHDLEAAVLLTLPPGAYTAIVSGVGATTGVALVDVFEVP